ncbi:type VII secretion-associated protein [Mycobacterium antarcticum]|uniref:type VII secretion-associated protein n=1 Tax=Mycolicibacterium sp. TUM20984 TaxID=3023368 RepID=UPI0023A39E3E|nr:type VII secretion-associated protein [Mycolicibacterium sp. TUM20984]GLP82314.1 type VII secretion-associated protein [Mycolicibacterium sp. TUM20984]
MVTTVVSEAVVVVGPGLITGPGTVDRDDAVTALECIDDDLALLEDRVVAVDDVWRDVLGSAAGGPCARMFLICPSWWPEARVDRVVAAAEWWSASVSVLTRVEVLKTAATVVEVAPDLLVVQTDGRRRVIARTGADAAVLDAVVSSVDGLAAVTVDVPAGVTPFGAELVGALRRRGVDVTCESDQTLVAAVRRDDAARRAEHSVRHHLTPRAAALAVAILSVAALTTAALGLGPAPDELPPAAWLVEGRVALEVPAQWTVERVTSGPGSARVQVVSTIDRIEAIHLTQSWVPEGQTLDAAAVALAKALAEQPDGIFVDFTPAGERAHRPAVTYREIRPDRHIDWTVLLDGHVRIAIGCQGAADRPGPAVPCDRAIRSAHAVTSK